MSAALLEVLPEAWVLRGSGILMRPEILLEFVDLVLQSEAVRRSPKKQQQNFLLLQSNRPSKTRHLPHEMPSGAHSHIKCWVSVSC